MTTNTRRVRHWCRTEIRHWQLYIMVLPALISLIIFAYKPMYGIIIAFKDYSFKEGMLGSPWVGFEQFNRLFHSYWFPVILKNTLTISVLSLVLGFPIPIILALMVNEIQNEKIKRTFQTVSYAPHFISTVVICGMIILFLNPSSGIINRGVTALGGQAVDFMQKPTMFKWVYVLSGIWQGAGWSAIIYFAALSGVDKSLLEAADIDGASRFQKIIYINFPVLVPTMLVQPAERWVRKGAPAAKQRQPGRVGSDFDLHLQSRPGSVRLFVFDGDRTVQLGNQCHCAGAGEHAVAEMRENQFVVTEGAAISDV